MTIGVLIIGMIIISTALKNTASALAQQLQHDLLGPDGFIVWGTALAAIGALGYIPILRQPSRYLLLLVAVVMVVRNGGIFSQLESALQGASKAGPATSLPTPALSSSGASSSGSSGSSGSNSDGGIAGTGVTWSEAAEIAAVIAL